jgi:hypothetical protein
MSLWTLTRLRTLCVVNSANRGTLIDFICLRKKYFFLPQRMSLRNSSEQFLLVANTVILL